MMPDLTHPGWRMEAPRPSAVPGAGRTEEGLWLASAGDDCFGRWISPEFSVLSGAAFKVSVRARLEGCSPEATHVNVYAVWTWLDAEGEMIMRDYIDAYEAPSRESLHLTRCVEAPEGAIKATLELAMRLLDSGRVIFTEATALPVDRAKSRPVRVASAFTALPHTREGDLDAVLRLIDRAAKEKPDILCLGEKVITGHAPPEEAAVTIPGPEIDAIRERARRYGMIVVLGLTERKGGRCYNAGCVVGADGGIIGVYHKVNLPLSEVEEGHAAGHEYPVFDTPIGRIGVMICWDGAFPETARILADKGAEIILMPSAWDAEIAAPARASDHGVFLVVSSPRHNRVPCRVYDPKGRIVAQCVGGEEYEQGVCVAEIDLACRHYSYWFSVGPGLGENKSVLRRERRDDTYRFLEISQRGKLT